MNGKGGLTQFEANANPGTASFQNGAASAPAAALGSAAAGQTLFFGTSSAASAKITNSGGAAASAFPGVTLFAVNATAGSATIENTPASVANANGGITQFSQDAVAADATIINRGAAVASLDGAGSPQLLGPRTQFVNNSSAQRAVITNYPGQASNAGGGETRFRDDSSAGAATITNLGASVTGALEGRTTFAENAKAGTATITAEAASVFGAGGSIRFGDNSSAENATLIARGTDASSGLGGGNIVFSQAASGGNARVVVEAGTAAGGLSIGELTMPGTSIGSLEGGGQVLLAGKNLTVGSNALDTIFSGTMVDGFAPGGSLTKVGAGTLTFSGVGTYTGTTSLLDGILRVEGTINGPVDVQGGILGGNGMLNGGINVGPDGVVAPGASIGSLTTNGPLAFGAGSIYGLEIDSTARTADVAHALGISIGADVDLFGQEIGAGTLPTGQSFTILDNFSANPTTGMFTGLGEGSELQIGQNLYRITYFGGDGNDVVLFSQSVPEPGILGMLAGCSFGLTVRRIRRRAEHRS